MPIKKSDHHRSPMMSATHRSYLHQRKAAPGKRGGTGGLGGQISGGKSGGTLTQITGSKSTVAGNQTEGRKVGREVKYFGCKHYAKKCAFVSPCCKKLYLCRVCHDENEDHQIDRYRISKVRCLLCCTLQQVGPTCVGCGVRFAYYFCPICHLYDDSDKKQFHCDQCGLCRVGGRENFFHCQKCDMCMDKSLKDSHKCVEKATKGDCPVCLDDLHTSRDCLHVMICGHVIHEKCWFDMLKKGIFECPLCGHSMLNLESVWKQMDLEIEKNPMPDHLRRSFVCILCKDCHKTGDVPFHRIGLKCSSCGSYNTSKYN